MYIITHNENKTSLFEREQGEIFRKVWRKEMGRGNGVILTSKNQRNN